MENNLFTQSNSVSSNRIIYTPSTFARSSLIHLQETGTLKALYPHKSERSGLTSCLFFTVLSGDGLLTYDGTSYELRTGDCVFIDCRKAYSHSTPLHSTPLPSTSLSAEELNDSGMVGRNSSVVDNSVGSAGSLWSLQWCHFYGPNMKAIYRKYQERGGQPVFRSSYLQQYKSILDELYKIADSADYVRDMRLHEKLSSLLILLMEDAWDEDKNNTFSDTTTADIQEIKEYLDTYFKDKITLDQLSSHFYINKSYMQSLFKDRYGSTINAYLNQVRITYVKQQLRFTDKTIEVLAEELHIDPPYLSRVFKKIEGISPSAFRQSWRGKG